MRPECLELFNAFSNFIIESGWTGGCYATAAMTHVLLKAKGIESKACIGVVEAKAGRTEYFDHGWLEIDGKPYDLTIPHSEDRTSVVLELGLSPLGVKGDIPSGISYGVDMKLDAQAERLLHEFSYILYCSPSFNREITYFDFAIYIAQKTKRFKDVAKSDLSIAAANSYWKHCKA